MLVCAAATTAHADEPADARPQPAPTDEPTDERIAEASALYERGTALHAAGKHLEAARTFARADALVPAAAALEAALVAVLLTDDAVLGMELASRTAREPFRERHIELADRARARFGNAVGRIVVHCDGCRVTIDGAPVAHGVAVWVRVGPHRVVIDVAGHREARQVTVEPAAIMTLLPAEDRELEQAPPPAVPKPDVAPLPPDSGSGISPVWFWIGLGVTGAAGAGTIISAADTAGLHADFVDAPSEALAADGEQAEVRTNALLGVTIGLAAVTGLLAAFTDWDASDALRDPSSAWLRF